MDRGIEDALLMGGIIAAIWAWLRGKRNRDAARAAAMVPQPVSGPSTGGTANVLPGQSGTATQIDITEGQMPGDPFYDPFGERTENPWANSFFGSSPATQPAAPAVDPVEKDWLARTIWGEARGESMKGKRGVAAVIMNRVADRRFPNTVQGVVRQPAQFSMWNPGEHNGIAASAVTETDAAFRDSLAVADEALTGKLIDPTGGAHHYYSPSAMVPRGSAPGWAKAPAKLTAIIGKHHFWSGVA